MTNLVERDGIKLVATFGAAKKHNPEMPNNWRAQLKGFGRSLTVDFFGGSAVYDIKAEDVLSSLCLDASAGAQDFDEFCSEFGYDTDSRKAHDTWKACKVASRKIRQFLGDNFDEYASAQW